MSEKLTVKAVDGVEVKSAQEKEQAVVEAATEDNPNVAIQNSGDTIKVDLSNPPKKEDKDAVQQVQGETEEGVLRDERVEQTSSEEAKDDNPETEEEVVETALGQIHDPEASEETKEDETSDTKLERVEEQPKAANTPPKQEEVLPQVETQNLPEGVDKLVEFLNETGGTVEDYVNLNRNIEDMDDNAVIREYYRQKNPNMKEDRLTRKMNKNFKYDEDIDDPDVIQDKKDLFDDELYAAQQFLSKRKEKYYQELKASRGQQLTPEAQEAVQYYNDQKLASERQQELSRVFLERTDKIFNEDFKGFEFKVGDQKYRIKADANEVKTQQSDLTNFISKFVGEDGTVTDAAGYHKALYAANNVDELAEHFYNQGRADAVRDGAKESKNISMGANKVPAAAPKQGTQARVVSNDGQLGNKLRIKTIK